MKTTTIRVSSQTRDQLNALARRRGAAAGDIVTELVQEADDRALLEEAAQGWEQMAHDASVLARYHVETGDLAAFDARLPDY